MEEKQNIVSDENQRTERGNDAVPRVERESGIGTGKKVGLYGCGFLVLVVITIFIVLAWTGFNVPFVGTEEVGP